MSVEFSHLRSGCDSVVEAMCLGVELMKLANGASSPSVWFGQWFSHS